MRLTWLLAALQSARQQSIQFSVPEALESVHFLFHYRWYCYKFFNSQMLEKIDAANGATGKFDC